MKILRFIICFFLVADLCIFAFFHELLRASDWTWENPAVMFVSVNLVLVLLMGLYDLLQFHPGKKTTIKYLSLPVLLVMLLFFIQINPLEWPMGHRHKMAGKWNGKMSSGQIVFYESGLFELDWSGWAREGMYHGSWFQKNDKIYLRYSGKRLDRVGEELLLKNDTLFPLNGYEDAFLKGVEFTLIKK